MRIPALLIVAAMVLAGCTSDGELDPRILDQSWSDKWEKRWLCDGLALYKKGFDGKVVFGATDSVIFPSYNPTGLEHRWDWGGGGDRYRYSVVLRHEGSFGLAARYYDFSFADDDGIAKSRATFWDCH